MREAPFYTIREIACGVRRAPLCRNDPFESSQDPLVPSCGRLSVVET